MNHIFDDKNFCVSSAARSSRRFPATDSFYQALTLPDFRGGRLSSFRNISREYFRKEARGEFCREIIAFAVIVVTAAIPVASNLRALGSFLRVIGGV